MTFSWTSLLKRLVLKAFLAGNLPKKLSNVGVLDERSTKSKKTLRRNVTRAIFAVKTSGTCTIWNSSLDPADPPDPADQVSESAARTLPSTRAGGQDDGSLREFVLTHVILAPGARGRGGPSSYPWRHFRGIHGILGIREIVASYMCFYSKSDSGDTPVQCVCLLLFHTPLT